ncbi:MAG: hypothetical protein ABIH09_02295 [Candidatus Omnitrophota bacterium]
MKKAMRILLYVVLILVVISFSKDAIIQFAVEHAVEKVTGLQLKMSKFRFGIVKPILAISNLRMYNPKGYPDRIMLDVPEIYINYDFAALLKKEVHLQEMKIHLKELVVVKNKEGEVNLDSLKIVKESGSTKKSSQKKKKSILQIDTLDLKIGKAFYKDYSKGVPPEVKEFDINIDESYHNIQDLKGVISLIMAKTLAKTTIAKLANFEIDKLKDNLTQVLLSAKNMAPVKNLSEVKGVFEGMSASLGQAFVDSLESGKAEEEKNRQVSD